MYSKLSGMTGTAKTEEEEFRQIYGLDVVEVPTNKPMIRVDNPDRFFYDEKRKFEAIVKQVKECNEKGQPVLIGTSSVEKSEVIEKYLKAAGLKFNMLNAKEHKREARVIAAAGRPGMITLATNMAGRGTDIMLGGNAEFQAREEVKQLGDYTDRWMSFVTSATPIEMITNDPNIKKMLLDCRRDYKDKCAKYKKMFESDRQKVIDAGGLCIIGTERHESRRIDNQLRGRAGRQGDPGSSTFYVSLGDDIMRLFGDDRMSKIQKMFAGVVKEGDDGDLSQNMKILSDIMEKAQKNIESHHFKSRKNVLQYDDILNEQRKQIYSLRDEILQDGDVSEKILHMIGSTVEDSIEDAVVSIEEFKYPVVDIESLEQKYLGWGCDKGDFDFAEGRPAAEVAKELCSIITEKATALYHQREAENPDIFHRFERLKLLKNLDERWLDHIDDMDDLKDSVMFQSYAQKDPLKEYKIIGSSMFAELINEIRQNTVRNILTSKVEIEEAAGTAATNLRRGKNNIVARGDVRKRSEKIKPNDPCPCGSGKKYKKCCGAGGGN
jgi:preprotein translocase subunit SecA